MSNLLDTQEMLRLDALDQYEVIGAVPDPALLELTELAAQICDTPIAAISLVGQHTLHFLARFGPGPPRLPRGQQPCESCIQGSDVLEITDARYHPDFRPDGILVAGRALRFYAGAPLTAASGVNIGCLFVQDPAPRTLKDGQKSALLTLSRQVVARFELNARARHSDRDGRIRQRVESALTVERNFISTVLDTVGALVVVFDTAGRAVRFNRTCEQVYGYDFPSLAGRALWEKLLSQGRAPGAGEDFQRTSFGRFPASVEDLWKHRDGSLRRIAWSASPMVDPQGETTFIIATGMDVTAQREGETTLRESEARYRELVEGSLGMICTHDLDGVLLSINTHGAESLGRTAEGMTGQNLALFMPEEYRPALLDYLREIREGGESQGRLALRKRDGQLLVIAFRNKLIQVSGREPHVLGFGVDISEQVRTEDKLRMLIDQSNSILETVGDGIYGLDLHGRVTFINPAAAEMLGYKAQEMLGRKFHEVVHHTRADGTPYPEEECLITRAVRSFDTVRVANEVFWRKDGSSFPVEYVARPQIDREVFAHERTQGRAGKAIGVVVAFADTTERQALDRMKDEFISTVSHELRTPLTSLRAALGLVTGGALMARPEKMQPMLEIAIGNTDRLIRLVNDILDLERISSGNADLHSTLCSAGALMEYAVSLQQDFAKKRGLRFSIDANRVEVWADPDRILQTLSNLISNAIKYSPAMGEIVLSAHSLDEHEAEFTVRDQGRGVPAEKLEHIFERFGQVDSSDSRSLGGTGLGLAICRSILSQHGGRIWVTSPPGEGATFHFTLPRHRSGHLR